jgi:hypothetical protein
MKANELRIGNWAEYLYNPLDDEGNPEWKPEKIDQRDITYLCEHPDEDEYRPIEITDEWLVNFGFEPMYNTPSEHNPFFKRILPNKGMEIYPPSKDRRIPCYQFICGGIRSQSFPVNIQYVHQLQNLYFSLTGEELILEIKDNA